MIRVNGRWTIRLAVSCVWLLACTCLLAAQEPTKQEPAQSSPAVQEVAPATEPQATEPQATDQPTKRNATQNAVGAVQPADYGRFENLSSYSLSPDGRWLVYAVSRVNEENELRLRMLATETTEAIAFGTQANFSNDSQWLAYLIEVSPAEREKLEKAKEAVKTKLGLRNLLTGDRVEIDNVASFAFSEDGRFLAMRRYPAKDSKAPGAGLVLRDLAGDLYHQIDTHFGNVKSFAFNRPGALLAMTIETEDQAGNGVQVYDCLAGSLRTLDSSERKYTELTWRKDADDLAVLVEFPREEKEDAAFSVQAWRGLQDALSGGKSPQTLMYDPAAHEHHPADLRIVSAAKLRWSDDGQTLFFGLQPWDKKPKNYGKSRAELAKEKLTKSKPDDTSAKDGASAKNGAATDPAKSPSKDGQPAPSGNPPAAEKTAANSADKSPEKANKDKRSLRESLKDPANVEVWHARDVDIIPLQKKQESRDKNKSRLAAWWLSEPKLVVLGEERYESVALCEQQKRAIGYDNSPYEELKKFGPTLNDLYLIDVRTGEQRKIVERNKFAFPSSPDGRYIAYLRDQQFWLYDAEAQTERDLTSGLDVPFYDTTDDTLTAEKRPWGIAGWTKASDHLLLYDEFDVWAFSMDSSVAPLRLTNGREDKIRHRRLVLDPIDEPWVEVDQPMYLSLYGDRSKKFGIGKLVPAERSGQAERLVWKDRNIGRLQKAKQAATLAYIEQAADVPPNIWVGNANLTDARLVSDTNPFLKEYGWSRAELVNYTNANGVDLQGALYYPANYEAGKQYPMIVYIYEERAQGLHSFTVPSERRPYNNATFTADGFFVFEPDIIYRPQNPGVSAVECVVPAVKKVLESGMIDEKRIGLIGHSWGAYQTSFIVTQTDLFAAGIAGAPLTNMMSMSMSIYWNSGQTDAWIFHESQGRMNRPFWQDVETYIKNSPIFSIDQMKTPLLIAFGDEDGAVDFNQGVELYNAARLAGKQFVMLVYPGENHGLVKKENQVDYHYRIREWFGHYLRGDEPAKWITDGQKHLDRQKEIESLKEKK
jgi:dipeptidyl aminopeptidase/acylaminoacyl peptidase